MSEEINVIVNNLCEMRKGELMCDCMTFPDTVEEFMEQYKVVDTDGIYMSNGAELVPIFRMRQWFEHLQSAQPERLTDDDFETIRIHLNAYKEKLCNQQRWEEANEYQRIIDRFMSFASAQPDKDALDNAYARGFTEAEAKFRKMMPRWIPCEEVLPEEEEYVLISKKISPLSGEKWCVTIAGRFSDGRSGKVEWRDIGFGKIYDDDVLAWMPRPGRYREDGGK